MDAARLNLSHGTYASHREMIRSVRWIARSLGKHVPIIADLQGPKIRLGQLPEQGLLLKMQETYAFSTARETYQDDLIPVTYRQLHKDVKTGDRFLIDDGLIELVVTEVKGRVIRAQVKNGGMITSHKGMNFPDSRLSVSAITKKDQEDIQFAVQAGVDWIAISFVKSADDIKHVTRLIKQCGKLKQVLPRVIAKIEKHEAIDAFTEILEATDAVMIARGDLGVEIPAQDVPVRQKEMIERCRTYGKPVIVATQMLDSMIRNPRPTRAEVSDVANAVFDHTDAVMLSGETATGKYPVEAVSLMQEVINTSEASPFDDIALIEYIAHDPVASIAHTIKLAAAQGSVQAVLVSLTLADWSETVLRAHPEIPFFVACPTPTQARQVALRWGSVSFVLPRVQEKSFVSRAVRFLLAKRLVTRETNLAVVFGGSHGYSFDVVRATGS